MDSPRLGWWVVCHHHKSLVPFLFRFVSTAYLHRGRTGGSSV